MQSSDRNADIEQIEISGPFAPGSTIEMTPVGQDTVELRVAKASEPNLFVDEADLGEVLVTTFHRIEPLDHERSLVTYRMEITGPAADTVGPSSDPRSAATSPTPSRP